MADKKEKQTEANFVNEELGKEKLGKEKDSVNTKTKEKETEEKEDSLQEITKLLRITQANFENFRKQSEKRAAEIKAMAAQDVLMQILPLLDHLELALKNVNPRFDTNCNCGCGAGCNCGPDCNSTNYTEFVRGIELIYSQLKELLKNNHLEQIKAVGEQFDPYYHEALLKTESNLPAGTIIEEFQTGFTLHGKVIRHAKVKVSSGKNTPTKKV